MKRIISAILVIVILMSTCIITIAEEGKSQVKERELLNSQIFKMDEYTNSEHKSKQDKKNDDIQSIDVYQPGTVRVDDYLYSEGGWMSGENRNFYNFETFKYASINIATSLPKIGAYATKGLLIFDALKAIYNDMVYIDNTKQVSAITKYTYRDFYHYLYVYDYNNTWKDIGHSLSRQYYKYYYMWYYNTTIGEFRTREYFYTKANGYDPFYIAKAPNYMNYTQLKSNAYEAWIYNTKYYESYNN